MAEGFAGATATPLRRWRSQVGSSSGPLFNSRSMSGFLLVSCARRTKYKQFFCILLLFRPTLCQNLPICTSLPLDVATATPMRPTISAKSKANLKNQGTLVQSRANANGTHLSPSVRASPLWSSRRVVVRDIMLRHTPHRNLAG